MGHENDTLQGRLYAHEREEDKQHRGKFGYWRMIENRMVREELIAAGHDPNAFGFTLLINSRIMENHKNDPTRREKLNAWAAAMEAIGAKPAQRRSGPIFTDDELRYLSDHFDMANDPTAIAILTKVRAAL